jgi:hypothetical protein
LSFCLTDVTDARSAFLDPTIEPPPKAASEQFVFKLAIDNKASITVSSDLAAFANLLASAFPAIANSTGSNSGAQTPPRGAALLSRGATSPIPGPSTLARASATAANTDIGPNGLLSRSPLPPLPPAAAPIAPMSPGTAASMELTALSERIHNACIEEVLSTLRMVHTIEKKIGHEAALANDSMEHQLRALLKQEIELMATKAADWLRQSMVVGQGYHLSEVARRSRVELFRAEQAHVVHKQWRRLSSQLFQHEGSPWYGSSNNTNGEVVTNTITAWKVDEVEDGLRMRRKLKPCQAGDHNHSTTALLAAREQAALQQARLSRPLSSSILLTGTGPSPSPSSFASSSNALLSSPAAAASSSLSSTVITSTSSVAVAVPQSSPKSSPKSSTLLAATITTVTTTTTTTPITEPISIPVPVASSTSVQPSSATSLPLGGTSLSSASSSSSTTSALIEPSSPASPKSTASSPHSTNSIEAEYSVPSDGNTSATIPILPPSSAPTIASPPAAAVSSSTTTSAAATTKSTKAIGAGDSSSSAPSSTASSPALRGTSGPPSDHSVTSSDSDDTDDAEQDEADQKRFAELSRRLGRSIMGAGRATESKEDDDDIAVDEAKASESSKNIDLPSPSPTSQSTDDSKGPRRSPPPAPTPSSGSSSGSGIMSPSRSPDPSSGDSKAQKGLSVDTGYGEDGKAMSGPSRSGSNTNIAASTVPEHKDQAALEAEAAAANAAALAAATAVLKEGTVHSSICIMVLPIMQLEGRLELGQNFIHFVPSPASLLAAATSSSSQPTIWPSAKKPYTLPSLDSIRHRLQTEEKKWPMTSIQAVYRRRYQLQRTALEFFMMNGKNYFFDFGNRDERNKVLRVVMKMRPPNLIGLCSRPPTELLKHSNLTDKWQKRQISNFEYLMHLNTISGIIHSITSVIHLIPVMMWCWCP